MAEKSASYGAGAHVFSTDRVSAGSGHDHSDILALDFDGVCCDGLREYFETSRRTCARVWPLEEPPADQAFVAFCALRPVILSGWEMPVLLRAITRGVPRAEILGDWGRVRAGIVARGRRPATH